MKSPSNTKRERMALIIIIIKENLRNLQILCDIRRIERIGKTLCHKCVSHVTRLLMLSPFNQTELKLFKRAYSYVCKTILAINDEL